MDNTKNILWSYGISGDIPIILIIIKNYEDIDQIYQLIKAHEYFRTRGVIVDLVVISKEEISYNHPLWNSIYEVVSGSHLSNLQNVFGGIFLLRGESILAEEIEKLKSLANIVSEDGVLVLSKENSTEDEFYKKISTDIYENHLPRKDLKFFNGIGGFDEKNSEYVIYPGIDNYTPLPWSNVLANKDFGTIVTESGGGYTWAFNSREYRISPWSNDAVSDKQGEYVYIEDTDSKTRCSPYLLPYEEQGDYEVTYGLGYAKYCSAVIGLKLELMVFVPTNEKVKCLRLRIKNNSNKRRALTVNYYLNPVLAFSEEIGKKHVESSFDGDSITFTNQYEKEFGKNKIVEKCSMASDFYKKDTGYLLTNAQVLEVNEEKEQFFIIGVFEEGKNFGEFLYREGYEKELDKTKDFYKSNMLSLKVNTPDIATNLLLNNFLLYQALSCRIWSRSSFYQSGGATGFRDQLQDIIPFSYIIPEIARKQILFQARHQFEEGDVLHWWHEEAGKGTRTNFSDDLLWLIYAATRYIEITGDENILEEQVEFAVGAELNENENEKYIQFDVSKNTASLFAHCIFAIEHALKYGRHGLLLMGSGDWNDGMNEVGNKGQGESVWLSMFMYRILVDFSPVCRRHGREDLADKYSEIAGKLATAINKEGWDGEWYKRAFFDDGTSLGSIENDECKIDSISQSWSVISGAGEEDKIKRAMSATENYLIDRENGIIKILTPPFSKSKLEPGYIKSYPEGIRENGGQYTHAAIWVGIAYAILKNGDMTFEVFDMLNPINHSRTEGEMRKYKLEPYVIAADIYSNQEHLGRGGWSWYTGAASWMYRFGIEYLLGIKKRKDKIIIEPVTCSEWENFEVEYKYRSTVYKIKVILKSDKHQKIVINNVLENGNAFTLADDGGLHFVEVYV